MSFTLSYVFEPSSLVQYSVIFLTRFSQRACSLHFQVEIWDSPFLNESKISDSSSTSSSAPHSSSESEFSSADSTVSSSVAVETMTSSLAACEESSSLGPVSVVASVEVRGET